MQPKCIQSVNAAAGRVLSQAELSKIEERLSGTMRRLARVDPEMWQGLSATERVRRAAEVAMKDVEAAARRKVELAENQAASTAQTEGRLQDLREQYGASRSRALVLDMQNSTNYIEAVKVRAITRMMELLDATKNSEGASVGRRLAMFLFDAENPRMTADLSAEIFGKADGHTGNLVAKEGAKAWLQGIDELRERFNAAGGDVRKLDYGYLPQPHDAARVRGAGAQEWATKVMPLLDRSRYLFEDGSRMGDLAVMQHLTASWEAIATEGMNSRLPGQYVSEAARANKGSESREIHFKDAPAYLGYMAEFGRGSMYDAMMAHIGSLSRSIGLVERYGPNPEAQMRLQLDLAKLADGELKRVGIGVGVFRVSAEGLWNILNGKASSAGSDLAATVGSTVRNVQTFGKLAGTVIKALPDLGTFAVTTGFNKLNYWDAIKNLGKVATSAETREFLGMHGLLANSAINELQRWSGENVRQSWSGRLANSTMKLSLQEAWDDWLTRAYQMTQMQGYGKLATKAWDDIGQWDRELLQRHGLGAEDWAVINRAQMDELHGMAFLTPDSIIGTGHPNALQIATKVLGAIRAEGEFAVLKPDLQTRGAQTWNGTQAGTGLGELSRGVMLFKSFPIAMINRHWSRMLDAPRVGDGSAPALANRAMYMGALSVSGMALGAISLQAVQVLNGKDPIDMGGTHAAKFWLTALATGGGLGFYGDLLLKDSTEDRATWDTLGRSLGGPVVGDLADLYALTKGNIDQAIAGKATHAGAEAVRFGRSHLPLVNLWYARAALDHAGLHALQENLSPGYLTKMQERAAKAWGQQYWWAPGHVEPARGPDLAKAVGQ